MLIFIGSQNNLFKYGFCFGMPLSSMNTLKSTHVMSDISVLTDNDTMWPLEGAIAYKF